MCATGPMVVAAVRAAMAQLELTPDAIRSVRFIPDTWRRWLGGHVPARQVIDRHADGGHLARADLLRYSQEVDDADVSTMKRLFVATMIWGSGTSNGRGPRNTARALDDERLDSTLRSSHALVVQNQCGEAYRTFRVGGVGPPFFTKWFWSASLAHALHPAPLILDSRVWASLEAVCWNSITAAGTRRRADRYLAYLHAMDRWSRMMPELGSPEALESVLFQWAGREVRGGGRGGGCWW